MNEWLVPDGFVALSTPEERASGWFSHGAICVLNTSNADADFFVDVYFIDQDPILNQRFAVGAQRSSRVIVGEGYAIAGSQALKVPLGVAFSVRIRSEADLAIQYTRVDTRAANNALMSAILSKKG